MRHLIIQCLTCSLITLHSSLKWKRYSPTNWTTCHEAGNLLGSRGVTLERVVKVGHDWATSLSLFHFHALVLYFLGFQITAVGDCSYEVKRHLLLGRKALTNLDRILKSRDITFLTKICLDKAMIFVRVMYGCESWTIKNAECQRIDTFELWCWRRLLRVPWTAVHPKGNQPWIFTGRTDAKAEANAKSCLIRKDPDAGKDWR